MKCIKEIIVDNTKEIINLNKQDQKGIVSYVKFSTWLFGFFSAGFVLLLNNINEINELTTLFLIHTKYILSIIIIIFIIYIPTIIIYRLLSIKIIDSIIMNSNYLTIQKHFLLENLNLISEEDVKNNVISLIIFSKLSDFSYLDDKTKKDYTKAINTVSLRIIFNIIFWFLIIGFIIEYLLIFFVLY